ncbi:FCD domain-containing protein [Gemmobacter serpentinus]|uniref:FCD domain-containing protein n=1 Tax=Gemmobacter serpentinus TaxID=2652247 RepID=UPI00124EED1F|nr:FCD domain-containing protein [Gemmobacter serpentinus]
MICPFFSPVPTAASVLASLRDQFETRALREAMLHGDVNWEGQVMRSLHLMNRTERDAARPETLEGWERAHREFHLTLLAGGGKPILLDFCSCLLNLHDRYRRIFLRQRAGDRNVMMEHSEIAQAAVARDIDYACDRLSEHLRRTSTNLRDYLKEQGLT